MVRIMNYVAEKIEEIIKEKGLDKKDVAKACGRTPGWLTNITKKRRGIKVSDLVKLREVLDVRIEELLPLPKTLDISEMTLIDLIRHIIRKECGKYCDLMKKEE